MSSAVSPDETPIHQGRNAAAGGPLDLEEISDQQGASSRGRRPSLSPDQLSPHSGIRRPAHACAMDADAVGGQSDQDSPDRLSPVSADSRRRPWAGGHAGDWWMTWLGLIGLSFLTFNSAMAIYQYWRDVGIISFVAFEYFLLVGLFVIVKQFEAAPPGSRKRKKLMVSVWIVTASLNSGFVYQLVGTTTKPTLQLVQLLWAMPASTAISVFIIFSDRSGTPAPDEELPV